MDSRDYLEMSFRSIACFSNDGQLDAEELGQILAIAERDGEIDHNEIRVLRNIISRLTPAELDADMQAMLQRVHDKINGLAEDQ